MTTDRRRNNGIRAGIWIASLALLALLFIAPRSQEDPRFAKLTTQEARVQLGLAYMGSEEGPMKGIGILTRVADADSSNLLAIRYLAAFSIQTGQYEKAVGRYADLVRATTGQEKAMALVELSDASVMAGDTALAISSLRQVFDISEDSLLLQSVYERLNFLKKI